MKVILQYSQSQKKTGVLVAAQLVPNSTETAIDADSKANSLPLPSFRNATVHSGLAHLASMIIFQTGFTAHANRPGSPFVGISTNPRSPEQAIRTTEIKDRFSEDEGAKPDAASDALDLVNGSRTLVVMNPAPKPTPIRPALALALEFKAFATHPATALGANQIQDVRNHFRNRREATQCDG